MVRYLAVSVAAVASSLLVGAAYADDAALRKELEARYQTMKAAITAHDADAFASVLAPGFRSVSIKGEVQAAAETLEQMRKIGEALALLDDAKKKLGATPEESPNPPKVSKTDLLDIKLDNGIATVLQHYDATITGPDGKGGSRNIETITNSTDTWIKVDDQWQIFETVTDETSMLVNGNLIDHRIRQ